MSVVIDGLEIVYRNYIDISVAVATPKVSDVIFVCVATLCMYVQYIHVYYILLRTVLYFRVWLCLLYAMWTK